ncbi:hypothetical protein [Pollutimonas harenae]|nr:hypothetical protein [Pollutimonas harenae]
MNWFITAVSGQKAARPGSAALHFLEAFDFMGFFEQKTKKTAHAK